jgi:hypothetical protein
MAFNSYEELKAAVEARRASVLTLEVDLGSTYSQEHEDAKKELTQAKAMKQVIGQGFLADNLSELEQRVAETKPESNSVWVQYHQLELGEWALLIKQQGLTPVDQYEKVLVKTFIGVYGVDPVAEDEEGNLINPDAKPLTTDAASMSSKGNAGILPGGSLHQVVQAFMSWQNSGGDVSIRPTKSGLV